MEYSLVRAIIVAASTVWFLYFTFHIFDEFVFPYIFKKGTKEKEKNPQWITPKLRNDYYGINDVDIIIADSKFDTLPKFYATKNDRYELILDDTVTTKDLDNIAKIVLLGKIKIKYNLWFPDKSAYWLSVLLYMLDGGNIEIKDNKPID